MKISMEIFLSTIFVSAFSFGGFIGTTYAAQLPSHLMTTLHNQSGIQVAEADSPNDRDSGAKEDGDREASDLTRKHTSRQTKQQTQYYSRYHRAKKHPTVRT